MLNRIILMGRLTRDPELRRTQSGVAVTSFSLAVERDFADKATGSRPTDFIDIVAWRSTAEFVSKYFSKGRMAVVEGRLQVREWKDQDGNKRRNTEVLANSVYFGDSKRGSDNNASAGSYGSRASAPSQNSSYDAPNSLGPSEFAELNEDDDELPF